MGVGATVGTCVGACVTACVGALLVVGALVGAVLTEVGCSLLPRLARPMQAKSKNPMIPSTIQSQRLRFLFGGPVIGGG